jgi:hypothetical protein
MSGQKGIEMKKTKQEWKEERDRENELMNKEIEDVFKKMNRPYPACGVSISRGWWKSAVLPMLVAIDALKWKGTIAQIKQKFCTLRVYIDHHPNPETDDEINADTIADQLIDLATKLCDHICEECGLHRENSGNGIGMAYCKECHKLSGFKS